MSLWTGEEKRYGVQGRKTVKDSERAGEASPRGIDGKWKQLRHPGKDVGNSEGRIHTLA